MSRRISLSHFINQLKTQKTVYSYQMLNEDFLRQLPKFKRIFYSNKQQTKIDEQFSDCIENSQQIYQCPTKRIFSKDSKTNFELVYEIHNGFTSEQIFIIENALQIVVNRLFKREILENMYDICKTSYSFHSDDTWTHSNLIQNTIFNEKYLLLKYQLICLKKTSENGEFPIINIYPSCEQISDYSGCISCIHHGSTFVIDGEFEIHLNPYELIETHQHSSNFLHWAARIVFQMLTNLGHQSNHNLNLSQIDIFQKSFLSDGKYKSN